MQPKYQFYEIVRVTTQLPKLNKIAGMEGAILGRSEESIGNWGYAVYIYSLQETWDVPENALEATGRMDRRETFYDGASISVRVDPETGEGKL